jgi:hypothetical protein
MVIDTSLIEFSRIIVHEVFRRNNSQDIVTPKYSDATFQLQNRSIDILKDRMRKALNKESQCVEMVHTSEREISSLITEQFTADESKFIDISKRITMKLAEAQKHPRIPGGILFIAQGLIGVDRKDFIAVLKSEVHDGLSKQYDSAGKLKLEYLDQVLMTEDKKLYKVGIFINSNGVSSISIYDHNMNGAEITQPAEYFYKKFLQCQPAPNGRAYTNFFYSRSKELIKNSSLKIERKEELMNGLTGFLRLQNGNTISVAKFKDDYLRGDEEKQLFTDGFRDSEIDGVSFERNTIDIHNKLKTRSMRFSTNVKIVAPAEDYRRSVHIVETTDASTTIKIDGKIMEP